MAEEDSSRHIHVYIILLIMMDYTIILTHVHAHINTICNENHKVAKLIELHPFPHTHEELGCLFIQL